MSVHIILCFFARGGGWLVYLSGCAIFRVSFSPIFSSTGYQREQFFLESVVKTDEKGKFRKIGLLFTPIFLFWSMLQPTF